MRRIRLYVSLARGDQDIAFYRGLTDFSVVYAQIDINNWQAIVKCPGSTNNGREAQRDSVRHGPLSKSKGLTLHLVWWPTLTTRRTYLDLICGARTISI